MRGKSQEKGEKTGNKRKGMQKDGGWVGGREV